MLGIFLLLLLFLADDIFTLPELSNGQKPKKYFNKKFSQASMNIKIKPGLFCCADGCVFFSVFSFNIEDHFPIYFFAEKQEKNMTFMAHVYFQHST